MEGNKEEDGKMRSRLAKVRGARPNSLSDIIEERPNEPLEQSNMGLAGPEVESQTSKVLKEEL